MSHKYAVHVIVVIVSFLVATTNIVSASGPANVLPDAQGQSIITRLSQPDTEQLVVENADDVSAVKNVSYLGASTVTSQQYYDEQSAYGTDDGVYAEATNADGSLIDNAVRAQTASTSGNGTPTRTKITEHVVQSGESIGSVARAYGLSTETVLEANGLTVHSIIRPGDKLKILPVDGVAYTVKRGDTLGGIAAKYGSDVKQIMSSNGLLNASELQVGDDLVLPGGKLPAPPPRPVVHVATYSPPSSSASSSPSSSAGTIAYSYYARIKGTFVPPSANDPDRMQWPASCHRITQYFHTGHPAIDIACPMGTPVYAAADGVVEFAGWNNYGYGNEVILDHQNGYFTRYAHSSKLLVKKGDVVKKGQVIMLIGSTGHSTGPHVHFEVLKGNLNTRLNPLDFVK